MAPQLYIIKKHILPEKCFQRYEIEFTNYYKVFENKIFADPRFDSEKIEFNYINIDELLDIQHNQFSSIVEKWMYERSSWTINWLIQHQLVISEIAPCEGSFYFPMPNELRNPMKGLINIQNEDNECFRWFLVQYLNPVNKNPAN